MLATTHITVAPVTSADPVFAAIETHREALHVFQAEIHYAVKKRKGRFCTREHFREAAEAYDAATSALVLAPIASLPGLRSFAAYVADLRAYGGGGVAPKTLQYAIQVWDLSDAMATIAEAMARLLPADAPTSTH
ncbi:hypothetical protein MKK55_11385 [Methylobacterium sp. J-059]|uniref:hypothetical protein n=1 Tax=Methylobacterium sp. J-059 TaxID=2836643 RepID=UPI001FBAFAAA|nr:hypothetical protein [Methylobacterium sp. J-059]MCJ2039538.1 hypothetical protein [Methylobacterium sp. J-059]